MTLISKRLFTTGLLAAAALAAAGAAQAQSALDNIMKSKTLKVAVPTDYPPYGFVGTDMAPQGLDIDTAKLIAAKMGVKLELVPVTSANRIPYLQTKKADLVISTLGKNAEREGDRLLVRLRALLPGGVRGRRSSSPTSRTWPARPSTAARAPWKTRN